MDRNKDLVMISRADITILDQEVFGVLGEVRGFKDTDSGAQSVSSGVGASCGYPSQAR